MNKTHKPADLQEQNQITFNGENKNRFAECGKLGAGLPFAKSRMPANASNHSP